MSAENTAAEAPEYPSLWARVGAFLIDAILVAIAVWVVAGLLGPVIEVLGGLWLEYIAVAILIGIPLTIAILVAWAAIATTPRQTGSISAGYILLVSVQPPAIEGPARSLPRCPR